MKAKPSSHPGEVVLELNRRDEPLMAAAAVAKSPFQLKQILIPMDFSDCAKKALQYAIPLAKEHKAAITLLYVVVPSSYIGGEFGAYDLGFDAEVRTSGEKALVKLAEEVREVGASTLIRCGSPAHEILEVAKELPADLIVISTHGRTGLTHVFLGSVAEHVVRRAPCPVLVVRERENDFASA
jgi:nucleotide-binding universal stress UspA family protein